MPEAVTKAEKQKRSPKFKIDQSIGVSNEEIGKLFGYSASSVIRLIREGVRIDYVYKVFTQEDLKESEKLTWLKKQSPSNKVKMNLWDRYKKVVPPRKPRRDKGTTKYEM